MGSEDTKVTSSYCSSRERSSILPCSRSVYVWALKIHCYVTFYSSGRSYAHVLLIDQSRRMYNTYTMVARDYGNVNPPRPRAKPWYNNYSTHTQRSWDGSGVDSRLHPSGPRLCVFGKSLITTPTNIYGQYFPCISRGACTPSECLNNY